MHRQLEDFMHLSTTVAHVHVEKSLDVVPVTFRDEVSSYVVLSYYIVVCMFLFQLFFSFFRKTFVRDAQSKKKFLFF